MSTHTRTRWHASVDLPADDGADPFKNAGPVEQIGLAIDLRPSHAELSAKLKDLLESEGELYARGVRCDLKEMDDSTCSACPISHHTEAGHPLATLCRIGREEERTLMDLYLLKHDATGQGT